MSATPQANYPHIQCGNQIARLNQRIFYLSPALKSVILQGKVGSTMTYALSVWWHMLTSDDRKKLESTWADIGRAITSASATADTSYSFQHEYGV